MTIADVVRSFTLARDAVLSGTWTTDHREVISGASYAYAMASWNINRGTPRENGLAFVAALDAMARCRACADTGMVQHPAWTGKLCGCPMGKFRQVVKDNEMRDTDEHEGWTKASYDDRGDDDDVDPRDGEGDGAAGVVTEPWL